MARMFDQRFEGKDNAGLRKRIREVVSNRACGEENARRVRALEGSVALAATGKYILGLVAEDFRNAYGPRPGQCDCKACSELGFALLSKSP